MLGQRRRVGSRAAARTPEKKGWPDSASSSFSLPADGKKPHPLQQKTNAQTVDFKLLFLYFFSDLIFVLSFFSDLLLPLPLQIVFFRVDHGSLPEISSLQHIGLLGIVGTDGGWISVQICYTGLSWRRAGC